MKHCVAGWLGLHYQLCLTGKNWTQYLPFGLRLRAVQLQHWALFLSMFKLKSDLKPTVYRTRQPATDARSRQKGNMLASGWLVNWFTSHADIDVACMIFNHRILLLYVEFVLARLIDLINDLGCCLFLDRRSRQDVSTN